jgi:hypothetical protein
LVDNHLRGINNSATAPTLKAEAIARGLKVPAGNKAAVLSATTAHRHRITLRQFGSAPH